MGQDRGLDLFGDPVGMWTLGDGEPVDEAFGPVGLIVASDLVKLLARIAHDPAGLGDVAHLVRKFEQAQLASCYLTLGGHGVLLKGWMFVQK